MSSNLSFNADFRFRIEQDWNSRKSNGDFRNDRSRLRYRLRAGFEYQYNSWASFGARIRTGDPRKQQDPQLTLGDGFKEFGTLPIALEKAYFTANIRDFTVWVGKNTFPFQKQNELFWSDNVFPEGIFMQNTFHFQNPWIDQISVRGGHFILNARGGTFFDDSYFQGIQITSQYFQNRLALWPGLFVFRNIQNIPDGSETYLLDYTIANIGARIDLSKSPMIRTEIDWYHNLENYETNDSIPQDLQNQKRGWVLALSYGEIQNKGDWLVKLTYAHLERYAAVDFMAQNDWARWDYSSFDSPDGRLTNLEGIELTAAYKIEDDIALTMKYYVVNQLIPLGAFRENGQRIRFDVDIRF